MPQRIHVWFSEACELEVLSPGAPYSGQTYIPGSKRYFRSAPLIGTRCGTAPSNLIFSIMPIEIISITGRNSISDPFVPSLPIVGCIPCTLQSRSRGTSPRGPGCPPVSLLAFTLRDTHQDEPKMQTVVTEAVRRGPISSNAHSPLTHKRN
jgi:hypothetical protein